MIPSNPGTIRKVPGAKRFTRLLVVGLVLGSAGPAPAQEKAPAAVDVAGRYEVEGENPDGSAYTGTAEITMTGRGTCVIRWMFGDENAEGICMVRGRIFTSAYWLGGRIGLASYDIRDDGSLHGPWTLGDDDEPGMETLTLVK